MISRGRTKLRIAGPCLLLTALTVVGVLLSACAGSRSTSDTSVTQVDNGVSSFRMQAEWDENYLIIEKQVAGSDLVIVGQVVKIDASRWNSADGKEWRPPEVQTLPIVYTTFYVEPTKVLKGEPKWGTPVALRATGVFSTAADQLQATGSEQLAMRVGENVVAFGRIEARYGPGGIYQPADAYWLESEENSLWAEQDGVFLNQGHTKDPAERSLMLSSLEAKITGYVANEQ